MVGNDSSGGSLEGELIRDKMALGFGLKNGI